MTRGIYVLPDDVLAEVRAVRKLHGVTLLQLANRAGMSIAAVSLALGGKRRISPDLGRALVELLPLLPDETAMLVYYAHWWLPWIANGPPGGVMDTLNDTVPPCPECRGRCRGTAPRPHWEEVPL